MRHFGYAIFYSLLILCATALIISCGSDGGPTSTTDNPEITGVNPDSGSVGDQVTITGSNFGSTNGSNTITFNGTGATPTSSSTTQVVTTVPSGATNGPVNLEVSGQTATGPNFKVIPKQELTITSKATFSVKENSTAVGTITATDPNGNDITFSLSGGVDKAQFTIDQTSGALAFASAPDFENPGDANTDNAYQLQVKAGDGSASATQNLTVTVTDVNENQAPTITSKATFSVKENSTAVGTITATDPNGNDITFSLSGGVDKAQFTIDQTSGALAFASAPDFENPGDANTDNAYQLQVKAGDGSASATQNLTVTVTDVNENQAPTITSKATFSLKENSTAVGTITATDPNGNDITFSLSGGVDKAQFTIDQTSGALAFASAPDFENPGDANTDNAYQLQVKAGDGSASATQNLTVTVSDVAAGPIAFTGGNVTLKDGQSFDASPPDFIFQPIPENSNLSDAKGGIKITAEATERNFDSSNLNVNLNGPDAPFINTPVTNVSIKDAGSGKQIIDIRLVFNGKSPDYENPADAGHDNTYKVDVKLTDTRKGDDITQRFTAPISDVDDAPTISSFNPTSGAAGSTVTITGTHFNATAAKDTVRFNGSATPAVINSASTTKLQVKVPQNATSGKITVTTDFQTTTSSASFTVSPGGSATTANNSYGDKTTSGTAQMTSSGSPNSTDAITTNRRGTGGQ